MTVFDDITLRGGAQRVLIYCKPCVHLKFELGSPHECMHPRNMISTWLEPDPDKSPHEINRNNDCVWYRKRKFGSIKC